MTEQYYTPSQVAAMFQVSDKTVRGWVNKGVISGVKMGTSKTARLRIPACDPFLSVLAGQLGIDEVNPRADKAEAELAEVRQQVLELEAKYQEMLSAYKSLFADNQELQKTHAQQLEAERAETAKYKAHAERIAKQAQRRQRQGGQHEPRQ